MLELGTFSNYKSEQYLVDILNQIGDEKLISLVAKHIQRNIKLINGLKLLKEHRSFQSFKKLFLEHLEKDLLDLITQVNYYPIMVRQVTLINNLVRNICLTKLKQLNKDI